MENKRDNTTQAQMHITQTSLMEEDFKNWVLYDKQRKQ